jgi:hypothetical protein
LKKAPKEKLLDIDHLRSFEVEPAYFGLGFIQLKIKRNGRVHFYHDDLPVLAEEPHNHRYGFISYIMQGYFDQTIYQFTEDAAGTYYMDFEDCNPDLSDVTPPRELIGSITELFHAEYQAGDYYRIEADTLHTVSGRENAITYLVRDEPFKDFAGVVRGIGEDKVCPFSQPIPVKECWEMIEDMLPARSDKKKKKLGYHMRDIPKGKVGEPEKIVEEAYEILDAHEQGIRIMAELEMSDLYGALDRYREKYYPELDMKDIERMYRVTRRAFDNGKRK